MRCNAKGGGLNRMLTCAPVSVLRLVCMDTLCTCAHAHTFTHACARTHVYTHAQSHACTHARTHTHTHTHTHTCTHTHTRTSRLARLPIPNTHTHAYLDLSDGADYQGALLGRPEGERLKDVLDIIAGHLELAATYQKTVAVCGCGWVVVWFWGATSWRMTVDECLRLIWVPACLCGFV